MTETNEQTTVRLEREVQDGEKALEGLYVKLNEVVASDLPKDKKRIEVLKIYGEANRNFGNVERFVGHSELLGAHDSPIWLKTAAQTSAGFLNHILQFFRSIRVIGATLDMAPEMFKPDPMAYAAMQELTKAHLAGAAAQIRSDFHAAGLPTHGFDDNSKPRDERASLHIESTADKHSMKVDNLRSADAARIAAQHTSVRVDGKGSAHGSLGDRAAVIVEKISASTASPTKPGSWRSNWEEFKQKGIAGISVKLIAAALIGLFTAFSAWALHHFL